MPKFHEATWIDLLGVRHCQRIMRTNRRGYYRWCSRCSRKTAVSYITFIRHVDGVVCQQCKAALY